MGLRIIDRHKHEIIARTVTEAEVLASLAAEASHWPAGTGRIGVDNQADFIDNFRRVRARLESPAQIAEMATRVRAKILRRQADGTQMPHVPVDVVTLLELL